AGTGSRDEVVRARDLRRMQAEPVDPGVAARPAGEQPAVARHRVGHAERRAPPCLVAALGVDRRLEDGGLAVPHVAQVDPRSVAAPRPQQHGRLLADRSGRLRGVPLRAVVVRLVEERLDGPARVDEGHPLTEPAVRPPTIQRCRNRNRRTTGIIAINAPAQNGPHSCPYCWLTQPNIPTGSVKWLFVWSRADAITNSLRVNTKEISATTISTGSASGSTTPQKICAGVA